MRTLFIIPLVLMSLVSFPSWGLTMDDLVKRNDLYYEKFTNVPFTGKISGIVSGRFERGRKHGKWLKYFKNGQLYQIDNYIDGIKGSWEQYYDNGQLESKGSFNKNGYPDGLLEFYYKNGQLENKGSWKDGYPDGLQEYFNKNGSLKKTETYIDGVKQK